MWEILEALLRIDERILKTVVFIGAENERGFTPYGTAVIGYVNCGGYYNTVLITCAHVVEQISGDLISVRINRKDGTSETRGFVKDFLLFEDRSIDICVAAIGLDPSIYDFYPIPLSSSQFREGILQEGPPGSGDEVCVVGLYTSHFGCVRNRPIVRMGHLAAMLEEQVMTNRGHVWGYLIECHSIAGLSGSPVFWMKEKLELKNGKVGKARGYFPLGILLGYHVVETKEDEILVPQFQHEELGNQENKGSDERRTGFAVVLPINHACNLVESEEFYETDESSAG